MVMRPLGDTVVNGQQAVILEEDYVAIQQSFGDSVLYAREFVAYELDQRIFILDDQDSFRLTYDFNLAVGDSIVYEINGWGFECDNTVTYYLDSLSTFSLGTENLTHQFFSFYDANWDYFGKSEVIQNIGNITSAFDLNRAHVCAFDLPGTWLCSFGDEVNEEKFLEQECYELPLETEEHLDKAFLVFPNPVTDHIQVEAGDFQNLFIYNLQGELMRVFEKSEFINLSFLFSGVYLCVIHKDDGSKLSQTIVKK